MTEHEDQEPNLTPAEQLEVMTSYIDAHYPMPPFTPPWKGGSGDPADADAWSARLPDRITHTAMLQIGPGLDQSMPGVAYAQNIRTEDVADVPSRVFLPEEPTGSWAISLHSGGWWRGSGDALDLQWRPEVAAAAALSGTTILDVDYPLAPAHTVAEMVDSCALAIDYARSRGATSITAWGYSSGGALATLVAPLVDALVLTFPDLDSLGALPEEIRGDLEVPAASTWPPALVQIALEDGVAKRPEDLENAEVREYMATHRISTPEVARERIQDVASFLRGVER